MIFTAKEGEVTALVGPSGSGKSTCARLAARLWDIDSGTIKVGGVNIAEVDPETLMTDYSMVFQDVVLFDDTVMENIRLGRHGAADEEVRAAARAANCDEFVDKLPQGYHTPIGENGARLSGGERQRIAIARALIHDPRILILDEATAAMDNETEKQISAAIDKLIEGRTTISIAHRLPTLKNCNYIMAIEHGELVEMGTAEELLERKGVYYNLYTLQNEQMNRVMQGL